MKTNKSHKKNNLRKVLFVLFLAVSVSAFSQITLPGGDDNVDDVNSAPIDGFLGIGLIAGAALGVRSYLKNKNQN